MAFYVTFIPHFKETCLFGLMWEMISVIYCSSYETPCEMLLAYCLSHGEPGVLVDAFSVATRQRTRPRIVNGAPRNLDSIRLQTLHSIRRRASRILWHTIPSNFSV